MKVSPHVKVLVALLFTLMAMTCSVDCKPVTTTTKKPKPNLTYAAGPNQLTLLMSAPGAFRFAYETDNQFRAERRFANGTVIGFHGSIGADGKAVRVSYGDIDQLGFHSISEIIPDQFPEVATTLQSPTAEEEEVNSNTTPAASATQSQSTDEKIFNDKLTSSVLIDYEKESVSVDAADYVINQILPRNNKSPETEAIFTFPYIELSEFRNNKRQVPDEPVPIIAPFVEPPIITDPSKFTRLTARAKFTVSDE